MSLASLTAYYSSLLAYQYRGLANADRQVQLWASQMIGENLAASLLTCFDIDLAVGTQLDTLGKYVGVSRNIGAPLVRPYFGLWEYDEAVLLQANYQGTWNPTTNTPTLTSSSAGRWWVASNAGTSTSPVAATFACGDVLYCSGGTTFVRYVTNTPNGNGLTTYADPAVNANGIFYQYEFSTGQNTDLSDAQYRTVIKLKAVLNASDGTLSSIMAYLHQFFPEQIWLVDTKDMNLAYTVLSTVALSPELLAIYLPRPMGVGISVTIISPTPGGGDTLTTEAGFTLTTEDGTTLITEST